MASKADIWALFSKLPRAKSGASTFLGQLVPGRLGDYLVKGAIGEPTLLLRAWSKGRATVPIELRNLSIEYQLGCRIKAGSKKIEGEFVRIACLSDDVILHRLFISAGEAILKLLPPAPSEGQIYQAVEHFAELFMALTRPSTRSVKGLWGELFVISECKAPADLVTAWHVDPEERFDFSRGSIHLEVKASERPQRIHEFSVGQLRTTGNVQVFIASVLLQRSAGGAGIADLARRIAERLKQHPKLGAKVWGNVAKCLGRDFSAGTEAKFDEEYARASLRVVLAQDVACIDVPLPPDVISAKVQVSLDKVLRHKSVKWAAVEGAMNGAVATSRRKG